MNDLNNNEKKQELTEEQQEILKQIENAESEEELLELIEKLKEESEDADIKITPIRVDNKKRGFFRIFIDCVVTIITLLGLIGIIQPFTYMESSINLVIFLVSVILVKLLLTVIFTLVRNPFIFVFKNIIIACLMIPVICIIPVFLNKTMVTNYNSLFVVGLLSTMFRIVILSTINKLMRGKL